jgi:hypothetical protein
MAFSPLAQAQGWGPDYRYERRDHCERLRDRLENLRHQIRYAAPWERERMGARMHEIRQRLRNECWGR